eukprot:RCo013302
MHFIVAVYLLVWFVTCVVARRLRRLGSRASMNMRWLDYVQTSPVLRLASSELCTGDIEHGGIHSPQISSPVRSSPQNFLLPARLSAVTAPEETNGPTHISSAALSTAAHIVAVMISCVAMEAHTHSAGALGCSLVVVAVDLLSAGLRWQVVWRTGAWEHLKMRNLAAAALLYGSMLLWPIGMALLTPRSLGFESPLWGVVAWGAVAQAQAEAFAAELTMLTPRQVSVLLLGMEAGYAVCVAGCSAWLADGSGLWSPSEVSSSPPAVVSGVLFVAVVLIPLNVLVESLWCQGAWLSRRLAEVVHSMEDLLCTSDQQQGEIAALKAKSGSVSTLAHEVRTPLNALLACCTLLADTALTREQKEYVNLII